jgi:hypothetical protein
MNKLDPYKSAHLERCPSGLRSTPGKRVYVYSVPRVRIPLSPPGYGGCTGRFAAICCEPRQIRKEAAVTTDSGAKLG